MNEEKTQRSEVIATTLLRVLAIIGFIAVLALASWALVRAIGYFPDAKNGLTGTVSSLWSTSPESLAFSVPVRTLPVDEPARIEWAHEGAKSDTEYSFAYTCTGDVSLQIMSDSEWTSIPCDTPVLTRDNGIRILPTNENSRFSDVQLTVRTGELADSIVLSIVNTDIPLTADADADSETPSQTTTTSPTTNTPSARPVTTTKTVPQYSGLADLAVEIKQTGVLIEVEDENTFFPVSPIPADKVAGVVFTVTNKGGLTSNVWRFEAELPIEGDKTYEYTSPLQNPLSSGMQVEFTLGFDEILNDSEGTIEITLIPGTIDDAESNNKDSVVIEIKE